MSTLDRMVARLLVRWLREPVRQVLAEQDPRQAGPRPTWRCTSTWSTGTPRS